MYVPFSDAVAGPSSEIIYNDDDEKTDDVGEPVKRACLLYTSRQQWLCSPTRVWTLSFMVLMYTLVHEQGTLCTPPNESGFLAAFSSLTDCCIFLNWRTPCQSRR